MNKREVILWCVIALLMDASAMEVRITEPADGAVLSTLRVKVNGTITDGTPPYRIFWRSDLDDVLDNVPHTSPDMPNFWMPSVGAHRLTLEVRDSTGAVATDSIKITVVEPQLNVSILSPAEGTIVGDVQFSADVSGSPPYRFKWSSDRDGVLGDSERFGRPLSAGEHQITLKVTDDAGLIRSEAVKIFVQHKPAVWILSPLGDTRNEKIDFTARITDGTPPYRVEWSSDRDGVLGSTERFSRALSFGGHQITLKVVDSAGLQNTQSIWLTVWKPLSVDITEPSAGSFEGDVFFNATVAGGKVPYNIRWESSLDGFLSNVDSFDMPLSEGKHRITVHVTDDDYFAAEDSVDISVHSTDYAGYAVLAALALAAAGIVFFVIKLRRESQ